MSSGRMISKSVFVISSFLLALSPMQGKGADNVPKLQIRLIRASNQTTEKSDPKVQALDTQLKADFGYSNYQLIFSSETQFIRDEKAVFEMPDDFSLTVTYHGKRNGNREFFVETA